VDDADGTKIEGVFYTKETQHFYEMLDEGRTYLISGADITHSNKKFTSIEHDFSLIFKMHSTVD